MRRYSGPGWLIAIMFLMAFLCAAWGIDYAAKASGSIIQMPELDAPDKLEPKIKEGGGPD